MAALQHTPVQHNIIINHGFDTECRSKHKEVSAYAKLHPNSHLACERKKQLKQLLRRKKRTYKKLQGRQLCALAKTDPASFWR